MIIRADEIGENGLKIRTVRKSDWLTNIPEINDDRSGMFLSTNIDMDFMVTKVVKEVTVQGSLYCEVNCICSRCLENVNVVISPGFVLVLTPGSADQDQESDIDFESYDGETIDLSSYLREKIAVSLPVKVVCSTDCKGLCTSCGANLNTENCNCENNWVDPRFAKLKNIKV